MTAEGHSAQLRGEIWTLGYFPPLSFWGSDSFIREIPNPYGELAICLQFITYCPGMRIYGNETGSGWGRWLESDVVFLSVSSHFLFIKNVEKKLPLP